MIFLKIFVDDSSKPIEQITIRLKSANTNFSHIMKPLGPVEDFIPIERHNEMMIFLDDSYEINMLIKEINFAHFGEWRVRP